MISNILLTATTDELTEAVIDETSKNVDMSKIDSLMQNLEQSTLAGIPFEAIGIGLVILVFLTVCLKFKNLRTILGIVIIGAVLIFFVTHPKRLWEFWEWVATTFKGFENNN